MLEQHGANLRFEEIGIRLRRSGEGRPERDDADERPKEFWHRGKPSEESGPWRESVDRKNLGVARDNLGDCGEYPLSL